MAGIFKLLFDLSLYYGVTGFFLVILFHAQPFLPGFGALCAAMAANRLLGDKGKPSLRFALLLLPPLVLLLWPGLAAAIHMLPAWLYLLAAIKSDRTYLPYEDFKAVFQRYTLLTLSILPFIMFAGRGGEALAAAVPYLALMLVSGITLLRMLRDNNRGSGQMLIMAIFAIVCILLTVGRAPQLLGAAIGLLYNYLLRPILQGMAFAMALLLYGFARIISYLFPFKGAAESQEQEMDFMQVIGELGYRDEVFRDDGLPPWIPIALYILLAVGATVVLILFFRKLLGFQAEAPAPTAEDSLDDVPPAKSTRRRSITRPRDPRLAVRYYYGKFLRECSKRGLKLPNGSTSEEICRICADYFPGEDPALLREFYVIARYSAHESVTSDQADRAAVLWRRLKRTKSPANKT